MVRLKVLSQYNMLLSPSGIKPATFRLVVQCLNQLRHRVPQAEILHNREFLFTDVYMH
jgi:hypothetical protein